MDITKRTSMQRLRNLIRELWKDFKDIAEKVEKDNVCDTELRTFSGTYKMIEDELSVLPKNLQISNKFYTIVIKKDGVEKLFYIASETEKHIIDSLRAVGVNCNRDNVKYLGMAYLETRK